MNAISHAQTIHPSLERTTNAVAVAFAAWSRMREGPGRSFAEWVSALEQDESERERAGAVFFRSDELALALSLGDHDVFFSRLQVLTNVEVAALVAEDALCDREGVRIWRISRRLYVLLKEV